MPLGCSVWLNIQLSFFFHLGVYCYSKNHPVVRVEILGYIVSVDVREKLTTYGGDILFHYLLFKRCYGCE